MNANFEKTQESKSQSVSNTLSQRQSGGESIFPFVDNRPGALAQRKLQDVANNSAQAKQLPPIQKKENNTGLPDNLKSGIENLSGYSMDDVKVHYNSQKPAQLQAHAYAQGTDIHIAPGQERHLPHEAWHVVQQKQGRVRPTIQMKSMVNINDDPELEKEADEMGKKVLTIQAFEKENSRTLKNGKKNKDTLKPKGSNQRLVIQRLTIDLDIDDNTHGQTIISNINIEGRAPTSGDGAGQGDHTVSSSLINLGIVSQLYGRTLDMAFSNMVDLFEELLKTVEGGADVGASRMVRERGVFEDPLAPLLPRVMSGRKKEDFTIKSIIDEMDGLTELGFLELPHHKQITLLKTWIEKYIRLANQRDNTSFPRSAERTAGGGQEGPAQDRLIEIRNGLLTRRIRPDDTVLKQYINALLVMADFRPYPKELPMFMNRLLVHGHQIVVDFRPSDKYVAEAMWNEIVKNVLANQHDLGHHLLIAAAEHVSAFFGIEAKL